MTAYGWLKVLHVASVVIFLGNIITGLFWHSHASRTRDRRLVAHAMAGIIRSDRLFTVPGVFLIIATGVATAMIGKLPIFRTWGRSVFERLRETGSRLQLQEETDLREQIAFGLHGLLRR